MKKLHASDEKTSFVARARGLYTAVMNERLLRLYDCLPSGNGYKVRLLFAHLGIRYERVEVDVYSRVTRTPAYLAKNPNGRIPMIELPSGDRLTESNAILLHFAEGTRLLPEDRWKRAKVLEWLFYEQYEHEPTIASVRFWKHTHIDEERRVALPRKEAAGYAALTLMDRHLAEHDFFVGGFSIADIALYAYTHVAGEGGFELARFPAVERWLARVAAQPGHVPITFPGDVWTTFAP